MKFIKVYIIVIVVLISNSILAQDIHFSQFTTTPTFINPAAAGTYGGDYRTVLNFKEQYSSFNNAYRTYKFSYDAPVLKERNLKKVGIGIDVFQDIAGDSKTKMTDFKLSGSYTLQFSSYADLSFGIGIGYTRYTADYSNLTWDEQYNGLDLDESLPTQEIFFGRAQGNFDFNFGLFYRYFDYDGFPYEIGFSASHLSRPKLDIITSNLITDRLPIKYIFHAKKEFEFPNFYDRYGIIPKIMLAKQRTAYEFSVGALIRYDISLHSRYTGYYKNTTIYGGLSTRFGLKEFDAIIPEFYINLKEKFTLGISYDVNISKLVSASRYKGGLEVSLSMAGFFSEKYKVVSPVTF